MNRMRITTVPPTGSGTVSRRLVASNFLPLIDMIWKSFTWMWNGCSSLVTLWIVHSSVVPSFGENVTRFGSNSLPLM